MKNESKPIFTTLAENGTYCIDLTKREYFARQVASRFFANKALHLNPEDDAEYIIKVTDALLAELQKGGGE